jgi:hypothetical protein
MMGTLEAVKQFAVQMAFSARLLARLQIVVHWW